jgi:hypothetical protein
MGNVGERINRAEEGSGKDRCPDCGGFVPFEELYPGGEVRYPFGPPCPTCNSKGTDGKPGRVIVATQHAPARPGLDDEAEE